jgi:hypothetical protein
MATVFAEWRFLLLTLLICAYLLTAPLIAGSWLVQMVLEALLLAMVLVTLSANPGWSRLRRVLVVLWLVSVAGSLLSVLSIRQDRWQWFRSVELLTRVPVLAVVAGGMLTFVWHWRTLTVDSIFATVAAYLLLALLFTQIYLSADHLGSRQLLAARRGRQPAGPPAPGRRDLLQPGHARDGRLRRRPAGHAHGAHARHVPWRSPGSSILRWWWRYSSGRTCRSPGGDSRLGAAPQRPGCAEVTLCRDGPVAAASRTVLQSGPKRRARCRIGMIAPSRPTDPASGGVMRLGPGQMFRFRPTCPSARRGEEPKKRTPLAGRSLGHGTTGCRDDARLVQARIQAMARRRRKPARPRAEPSSHTAPGTGTSV